MTRWLGQPDRASIIGIASSVFLIPQNFSNFPELARALPIADIVDCSLFLQEVSDCERSNKMHGSVGADGQWRKGFHPAPSCFIVIFRLWEPATSLTPFQSSIMYSPREWGCKRSAEDGCLAGQKWRRWLRRFCLLQGNRVMLPMFEWTA